MEKAKKNVTKCMALILCLALVFCLLFLTGCGVTESSFWRGVKNIFNKSEIVFQPTTRFLYSIDGGNSWSETIQEVDVNETYYLAIEMQISQSEETKEEQIVVATITIPQTTVLDCYLDDHPGVSITGTEDAVTNSISYDFDIVAGTSPNKFRVVFECKPLEEGRAAVNVVYDDSVSTSWDASGTIKYVEKEEKGAE